MQTELEELLQRKVYVFAKDYENKPFFLCNSVQWWIKHNKTRNIFMESH